MRALRRLAVLSVLGALASCGTINSNLGIPAGEEFRLGENEHGSFSVSAENIGRVAVRIVEEGPEGARAERATLEPGASAEAEFSAGTVAVFVNDTEEEALVKVKIVGDTELSMGYAATD